MIVPRLVAEECLWRVMSFVGQSQRAGELLTKNAEMDAAAALVVLSKLLPRTKLVTLDDRFRRDRRHTIPQAIPKNR